MFENQSVEMVYSDLTIVGGGIAGMCAAIAAARHGLKVVLINDRPVLGGNASSEICVNINGAASNGKSPSVYAREGGIVEEIKLSTEPCYPDEFSPAMHNMALFELVYRESNITLFLNTIIHDTVMENGKIKSVKGIQLRSERCIEFYSPLFVDASGDGVAAHKAGAHFMSGHEGKEEFGESLAPNERENFVMGNTLIFWSRDLGKKVTFKRPEFAYDITKMDFFKNLKNIHLHRTLTKYGKNFYGYWWIEYGGQLDTIRDDQEITEELRKLVYGFWDYIKNSGDFEDVDTLELDHINTLAGKRESRRFIGDYILTQNDVDNQTIFHDAVCHAGWPMDVHAPLGIYDARPATHWYPVKGVFSIPFRSLYSKNISNLMLAGRNISATHMAMGATRVMSTCGCMGQAVGTAAALCKKYNVLPGEISVLYAQELQYLLQRDDQAIIGKNENYHPELYEDVKIFASSTADYSNEKVQGTLQLNQSLCLSIPVVTETLESLEIGVKNTSQTEKLLNYEICGGLKPENYIPEVKLGERTISIPGGFDGWIKIPVDTARPADGKIYLVFAEVEGLGLYFTLEKRTGVVTSLYNSDSDLHTDVGYLKLARLPENFCFRKVLPEQDMYHVNNVVNGYSRPYGAPNLWISREIGEDCCETIEFSYSQPKNIKEIQLVFNTLLEEDNLSKIAGDGILTVIKDYDLEITSAGGQTQRLEVRDNYMRLCRHPLEMTDITRIRFCFKATHGAKHYEVYSVKLFS